MEIFLKLYDDADDWLSIAWLAAGTTLWVLLVTLVSVSLLSVSLWVPGVFWFCAAATVFCLGLIPVFNRTPD